MDSRDEVVIKFIRPGSSLASVHAWIGALSRYQGTFSQRIECTRERQDI